MFGLGTTELLVVSLMALLLFGNRLPNAMKNLGQSLRLFKNELHDVHTQGKETVA
ncbi:MAG: twin-arginine translocase TatA/TatE family subunit [Planctomycetales bacterium]